MISADDETHPTAANCACAARHVVETGFEQHCSALRWTPVPAAAITTTTTTTNLETQPTRSPPPDPQSPLAKQRAVSEEEEDGGESVGSSESVGSETFDSEDLVGACEPTDLLNCSSELSDNEPVECLLSTTDSEWDSTSSEASSGTASTTSLFAPSKDKVLYVNEAGACRPSTSSASASVIHDTRRSSVECPNTVKSQKLSEESCSRDLPRPAEGTQSESELHDR